MSAAAGLAAACRPADAPEPSLENATISARPRTFTGAAQPGTHYFGVWERSDSFLFIPSGYRDDTPAPLILMLHGAGGRASSFDSPTFLKRLDDRGIAMCAISSSVATWDRFALGGFGPDIQRMDLALDHSFGNMSVDPNRLAIGGFSDGASYALSAGVPNGDLFKMIIAFSAGALFAPGYRGRPPVYIAHGTSDTVIPIANSRDGIVPQLRDTGYTVTFREFTGGHAISGTAANEAFDMLVSL